MLLLDKIAENNIKAAIDRGDLDNLPGQGRPLKLDDDSAIPPELRVSYRILKNSGHLPANMQLRGEVRKIEALLVSIKDISARTKLLTRLSLLKARLDTRK